MSFSENLKQIRKEKGLSQEELAELLDVSRQAVSKWEQGNGYPEVEKLLLLSSKLNISLDSLMSAEIVKETNKGNQNLTGNITITSPIENVIVNCYKVISSGRFKGGKDSPRYALFAVSNGCSFWGEPTLFLGWYADEEHIAKEIEEIKKSIMDGISHYELQFSVRVENHWLKRKIIGD